MAVPRITKEELKQRIDGAAGEAPILVDVRLKYPYEHSTVTLPGAIRLNPDSLDASALPRDRDLVLYDSDPSEVVAERVGDLLARQGYRLSVLQGGIADWVTAKLPTGTKSAPQPAATAAAAAPPKG
jgi:rhodanese-related sulfurtransferase